jgi:hypothetical protein
MVHETRESERAAAPYSSGKGGTTVANRLRWAPVVAAMLLLVAALGSRLTADASFAAVSSTMHAQVGPGYDISLTFDDGSIVAALPPGTYTVQIADLAQDHNFHLFGPGVEQATSVEGRGSTTWTVVFRADSRYFFQCDPHPDLGGRFDVGTVAASSSGGSGGGSGGGSSGGGGSGTGTGGTTPKAAAPKAGGSVLGTLRAAVSGAGVGLLLSGKPVKTLKQGVYKVVVADRSAKSDFTLRRIGAGQGLAGRGLALTGVTFTGTRTVRVTLVPGRWKAYSGVRESATSVFFRVTK